MKRLAFLFDVFGRVRRRDFLLFLLGLGGFYGLLLGFRTADHDQYAANWLQVLVGTDWRFILFIVAQLATVCVIIKRLHDRDMSGYWAFALLIPGPGWAWMAYELCLREGTDGPNRFGPSPKSGYRILG